MLRSAWQTLQWRAARQPTLCSPLGTAVRSVITLFSLPITPRIQSTYVSCQVCGGAGSTVDGVTTMDICCSLKVFFTNEMENQHLAILFFREGLWQFRRLTPQTVCLWRWLRSWSLLGARVVRWGGCDKVRVLKTVSIRVQMRPWLLLTAWSLQL